MGSVEDVLDLAGLVVENSLRAADAVIDAVHPARAGHADMQSDNTRRSDEAMTVHDAYAGVARDIAGAIRDRILRR